MRKFGPSACTCFLKPPFKLLVLPGAYAIRRSTSPILQHYSCLLVFCIQYYFSAASIHVRLFFMLFYVLVGIPSIRIKLLASGHHIFDPLQLFKAVKRT
jgi:hypothetical protein